MKEHDSYVDEEELKETTNSPEKISKTIIKENYLSQKTKENLEKSKAQLNNKNNRDIQRNKYLSQRHLYDHKKEKKPTLVNITDKNLQNEYISEVNYLFQKFIFIIILSIIIFIQSLLILHNYKNYTEVILSQIFSAFSFFNSLFLITELYRDALRDQFRNNLFRLFSIFLCIFQLCLFFYEIMSTYIMYNKIKVRKEKCLVNKKHCGDTMVNNIILGMSGISFFGIIYLSIFTFSLGLRSINIMIGYELEVHQKQLMEDKVVNKKNVIYKVSKSELKEKSKNDKKCHLKKE